MRIRADYENNVFTRFKGLRAVTPVILMHITVVMVEFHRNWVSHVYVH